MKYDPLPEGVHETHVMMPTPLGTYECQLCWACTCHRPFLLPVDCGKQSRREPPNYGPPTGVKRP